MTNLQDYILKEEDAKNMKLVYFRCSSGNIKSSQHEEYIHIMHFLKTLKNLNEEKQVRS